GFDVRSVSSVLEPPEKPRGTRLRRGKPPPRSIGCRRSATPSGGRPAPTNPPEGESWNGEDALLGRRKRSPLRLVPRVVGARTPATVDLQTTNGQRVPCRRAPRRRPCDPWPPGIPEERSEEHTSELQSRFDLVC